MCKCDSSCCNRILQKGVQVKLEVFRTEKKVNYFALPFLVKLCSNFLLYACRAGLSELEKLYIAVHLFVNTLGKF